MTVGEQRAELCHAAMRDVWTTAAEARELAGRVLTGYLSAQLQRDVLTLVRQLRGVAADAATLADRADAWSVTHASAQHEGDEVDAGC